MISGESHWVFGKRYRLEVIEQSGKPNVVIKNNAWLSLYVPPATAPAQREQVLNEWYRQALKARIPALLRKWEQRIGVTSAAWGVRKMKTKWGSCDSAKRRLLFNLELAKKPPECLEYIVVHELLHLLERCHSDRFRGYLDTYLPHWRSRREMLNRAPLNHEIWP